MVMAKISTTQKAMLLITLFAFAGLLCTGVVAQADIPKVLLFSKTSPGAYRHDSIPTALDVITRLGSGQLALNESVADASVSNGNVKWQSIHSEDDSQWTDGYLMQFSAIAFIMTADTDPPNSTTLLSPTAQQSLVRFIQAGGGYVGVHSAAATLYTFPAYGRLVGAFFDYHPEIQQVGIKASTNDNPATSKWPKVLTLNEEVYHFRTDPRQLPSKPTVLLTNATAFNDPQAASRTRSDGPAPRPLAWVRQGNLLDAPSQPLGQGMDDDNQLTYSGGPGRMFYTSLGHANETWNEAAFQAHIAGGIEWVLQSSTVQQVENGSSSERQDSNSSITETDNAGSAFVQSIKGRASKIAAICASLFVAIFIL